MMLRELAWTVIDLGVSTFHGGRLTQGMTNIA